MNNEEENELNIIDLVRMGLANWYWFVLSVLICMALAFFYLKSNRLYIPVPLPC